MVGVLNGVSAWRRRGSVRRGHLSTACFLPNKKAEPSDQKARTLSTALQMAPENIFEKQFINL